MKTKLNELLEFPCSFTYKVMGVAEPELLDEVVEVVQRHAPGDYSPDVKPSSKGNYHSVSITINATHIEQVETLYEELGALERVKMVL
ncbi:putative lipoic acid-binding regulatory protein [Providencia alcalifaciens]|nr:putative lipoic acid-binding regulatory protein [Providencia alcalifaciens]